MAAGAEQFVKKYHKAMVLANKDNLEKVKARVASDWVRDWTSELGGPIEGEGEFAERLTEFLEEDLGFAERAGVSIEGNELRIDVEACSICPGNDLLRRQGEPSLCPILPTGLQAISRVFGRNATLLGVDKEGRSVGYCTIRYELVGKKVGENG